MDALTEGTTNKPNNTFLQKTQRGIELVKLKNSQYLKQFLISTKERTENIGGALLKKEFMKAVIKKTKVCSTILYLTIFRNQQSKSQLHQTHLFIRTILTQRS